MINKFLDTDEKISNIIHERGLFEVMWKPQPFTNLPTVKK